MLSNRIAVAVRSGDPDDFRVTRPIASMSVCAEEEDDIQEPLSMRDLISLNIEPRRNRPDEDLLCCPQPQPTKMHGMRQRAKWSSEWVERGEITLEAAAKLIGVCNMTALRMLRRGEIKGR
jgi:hypothetical protein